ncbi:FAD-dependent oxidoreductase [uncultured Hydrogenophaga sp.]|uniref:FAD-dependent oxidoreductase n=1 Tax=uncultured Hydrogenophaga sp. TaxID=199683 RepID=UPI00265EDF69|nr:FAD-dependent oxidoreductase [uncultured Hydrogenophaga sp.]
MTASGRRHLVLLGGGHAHLAVLAALARTPLPDWDVTLVSAAPHLTYSGMVPGLLAGRYRLEDCRIALPPLAQAAGIRWLPGRCTGIDAAQRRLTLAQSVTTVLDYDLLSIDTGGVMEPDALEARMPGAAAHALPARPIDALAEGWSHELARMRRRAQASGSGPSVAVIGGGAAGIELVFAARQGLLQAGMAGARLSLLTGGGPVAPGYPAGVRRQVERQLQRQGITLLPSACTGIDADQVHMGTAGSLVCDLALIATGSMAPSWLSGSGLDRGPQGHVAINRFLQSTSHPEVFAAGDVADRADHRYPRSGVHAVRAGPALALNLRRAASGQALQPHWPPQHTLNLLSCGTGHAVASYGVFCAGGGWVWGWKDRIDRGFMQRHRKPGGARTA